MKAPCPNQCEARHGWSAGRAFSERNFDCLIIVKLLPPVQSEFWSTHKQLCPARGGVPGGIELGPDRLVAQAGIDLDRRRIRLTLEEHEKRGDH